MNILCNFLPALALEMVQDQFKDERLHRLIEPY